MLLKSFNEKNDGEAIREHTILKLILFPLFYCTVVCLHAVDGLDLTCMCTTHAILLTYTLETKVYIAWYKHERGWRIQDSIQLCRPVKVESLHIRSKENKCQIHKMTSYTWNLLGPVVWRPFRANPGFNFNPGFFLLFKSIFPDNFLSSFSCIKS